MDFLLKLNKTSSSSTTKVKVYVASFEYDIGTILAAGDDQFLYVVAFKDSKNITDIFDKITKELSCKFITKNNNLLNFFEEELNEYFSGNLKKFTTPIKTFGTEFQKAVWNVLYEQPYGTTQTYADVAKSLGRSGSHARAIGAACGANLLIIVIPCHRIVASNSNGGFSCGLDRKEWLLQHEQKNYNL